MKDEDGKRDLDTGSMTGSGRKNNSNKAYQLVKDLKTEKQDKSTTIQVEEVSHRGEGNP